MQGVPCAEVEAGRRTLALSAIHGDGNEAEHKLVVETIVEAARLAREEMSPQQLFKSAPRQKSKLGGLYLLMPRGRPGRTCTICGNNTGSKARRCEGCEPAPRVTQVKAKAVTLCACDCGQPTACKAKFTPGVSQPSLT